MTYKGHEGNGRGLIRGTRPLLV